MKFVCSYEGVSVDVVTAWAIMQGPKFIKRADLLVPIADSSVIGFAKGGILRLIVSPEEFYRQLSLYLDPK